MVQELNKIQGDLEEEPLMSVQPFEKVHELSLFQKQQPDNKTGIDVPESGDLFSQFMDAKLSLTVDQVLSWVPAFRQKLLERLNIGNVLAIHQDISMTDQSKEPVEDVDYAVPILDVQYGGVQLNDVLLDGGSGVNILPEAICKKLGITEFEDAPFQVRMVADQRRVQPLGIIRGRALEVFGLKFDVNFVVLR